MDSEADFETELIHHLESIGGTIILTAINLITAR